VNEVRSFQLNGRRLHLGRVLHVLREGRCISGRALHPVLTFV